MGKIRQITGNKNAKAGIFYFFGNLFNKGIAFLVIPIFTRLMSTAEYGIYTTYSSWVPFIAVVVGLSLLETIRNAYIDYRENLDEYISSVTVLSFISLFAITAVGLMVSICLGINSTLVLFCVIQAYMSNLLSSYALKYMMEVKYVMRMMLLALPNAVAMIISIPVVYLMSENRHLGRIETQVAVYLVMGGVLLIHIFARGGKRICVEHWKYALPLSLPMIFYGISVNLLSNSDRSMITYFRGESETGIYGLIYNISMVASVITSAVENIWIPWFTNKLMQGDRAAINRWVKPYIAAVALLMCLFMLAAPEILIMMAPEEYWGGKRMLAPLAVAFFFIFLYNVFVHVELFHKKNKYLAINTLIAGILNILLNFILVPRYGAEAAAYTTLASYVVSWGLHYMQSRKLEKELFPWNIYVQPLLMCFGTMVYVILFAEKLWLRGAMFAFLGVFYGIALLGQVKKAKNEE